MAEACAEYKWDRVCNVDCIVWMHDSSHGSKKLQAKRRKEKGNVGKVNRCIPMLDTKRSHNGDYEYCDIIIHVDDTHTWLTALEHQYAHMHWEKRLLNGGFQRILINEDVVFITISGYTKTKKMMIQPGNRDEDNLLAWLKDFPEIKQAALDIVTKKVSADTVPKKTTTDGITKEPLDTTPKDVTVHTNSTQAVAHTAALGDARHQISTNTTPSNVALDTTNGGDLHLESTTENANLQSTKTVGIDTAANAPKQFSFQNSSAETQQPVDSTSTVHVNELLCFVQNRSNIISVDVIVKLCADFYTSEVIADSKKLLFDCTKPANLRYIKRTGTNKNKENIADIYKLFLTIGPSQAPTFVAKTLTNLPPLTVHDFDICRIATDIEKLNSQVLLLTHSQSSLVDVVHGSGIQTAVPTSTKQPVTSVGTQAVMMSGNLDKTVHDIPVVTQMAQTTGKPHKSLDHAKSGQSQSGNRQPQIQVPACEPKGHHDPDNKLICNQRSAKTATERSKPVKDTESVMLTKNYYTVLDQTGSFSDEEGDTSIPSHIGKSSIYTV
jgi:hypothetical protein